jgi:Na+-transporting methylmalonyl-CoA/oxaloacetate decarboxylase gamma subunit
MNANHDYLKSGADQELQLGANVLALMLKGAGYAMVFCLVIWFLFAAMYWVGKLLPEESRETEDPTPFSYNLTVPLPGHQA